MTVLHKRIQRRRALSLFQIATIFGLAFGAGAMADITNFETPGNLKPTHKIGCAALADIGNEITPADLVLGFETCIHKEEHAAAVTLLAIMRLRAHFDTKRVTDKTAHGAGQVLTLNALSQISERKKKFLSMIFERSMAPGAQPHTAICEHARSNGPPSYIPHYMIQHGLAAFKDKAGPALVDPFDAKRAWRNSLEEYFKCT
ncbi:hypothetical protein [Sulfitobacter mediterraneus]|uniref:Uncharacterized protein n=1 Tax=Sulfitobacter mediterraneus TaxID=83219 RepID=A0A2T6CC84_9RHOB|nr:hypothetical protein [Sulfitobacter mediterraneus]KIN77952.1 hypothetical protein Z950_4040 [Sulfitobacter mediterraneus KCTC 32188]PTX73117.1 hypothetical protein C8N31_10825 [Sulfitobacter mediterraneus]